MLQYEVYCVDIHVGTVQINEKGEYKYVVDMIGVNTAERIIRSYVYAREQGFSSPTQFFEDIVNGKSFLIGEYSIIKNNH